MRVLALGDLHIGSDFAVAFRPINAIQEVLTSYWDAMISDVGPVDCVIVNGDLCEGSNRADEGQTTNPDISVQIEHASKLLLKIPTKRFVITNGSKYHGNCNPKADRLVCSLVGGEYLDEHGIVTVDRVRFHVRHTTGYSKKEHTRSNSLMGDLIDLEIDTETYGDCQVVLRSHTHYHRFAGKPGKVAMTTPCWKWLDHFQAHNSTRVPDLGYVIFEVENGEFSYSSRIFKMPGSLVCKQITI